MPSPNVVSYNPSANATNVALNKILRVTFDTTLLSSSVSATNFALRHSASRMPIRVTVELDTTGTVVIITPATLLFKNSSFTLRVIGSSSNLPTGNLKASDDSNFTTTTEITFTTGDDIEVTEDQKTNAQQNAEGDIRLPSSVKLTSLANFQVLSTTPKDHSYNFIGQNIVINFNRNVNPSTVTGNITLSQLPFLDEQGWIARSGVVSEGSWHYQWNQGSYTGESADFFTLPDWAITTSGKTVTLSKVNQNTGVDTFRNIRYELDINTNVVDTSGNYLNQDTNIIFTSKSWPNYITPNTIRNEVYTIFNSLNLDFVHELVWKKMIEAYRLVGFNSSQFRSNGPYIKKYVTYGVTLDILNDLYINKSILAGMTKTLGDFTISYHPLAGDISKDNVIKSIQKKFDVAERAINYMPHTARVFIKGWASESDPPNFRTRLWKDPAQSNNSSSSTYSSSDPVANSSEERGAKLPGQDDLWS